MAQLSCVRFRATNAAGTIVAGAGLWVCETGATTPANIYTDADLTTPAANPLTSNAAGYWPQFYIGQGVTVDLYARETTSVMSTTLWQALEVDSVGAEDNGTFERDFGSDGRIQARGDDGIVQFEFGPPTGDNIGGNGRIGGWNGTSADLVEIDATTVETTGGLTVGGDFSLTGTGPVMKLLATGSISGISEEIALPAAYSYYYLLLRDVLIGPVSLLLRFSHDNGATYKAGASDYMSKVGTGSAAAGTGIGTFSSSTTMAATGGADLDIRITAASNGATRASGTVDALGAGSVPALNNVVMDRFLGQTNGTAYGRATNIQLYSNDGASPITGTYLLYGVQSTL